MPKRLRNFQTPWTSVVFILCMRISPDSSYSEDHCAVHGYRADKAYCWLIETPNRVPRFPLRWMRAFSPQRRQPCQQRTSLANNNTKYTSQPATPGFQGIQRFMESHGRSQRMQNRLAMAPCEAKRRVPPSLELTHNHHLVEGTKGAQPAR